MAGASILGAYRPTDTPRVELVGRSVVGGSVGLDRSFVGWSIDQVAGWSGGWVIKMIIMGTVFICDPCGVPCYLGYRPFSRYHANLKKIP